MEYAVVNIILGDMVDHKAPPDENLLRRVTRKLTVRRPGTPTTRRRVSHIYDYTLTKFQINDLQFFSETILRYEFGVKYEVNTITKNVHFHGLLI